MKKLVQESDRRRFRYQPLLSSTTDDERFTEEDLVKSSLSYRELEKRASVPQAAGISVNTKSGASDLGGIDRALGRTVDVVLNDMSEPWEQTNGFWKRSLSDPYYRMMNTSGINTRDHAGSMVSPQIYA